MATAISGLTSLEQVGTTYVNARHAIRSIAFLKANRLRRPDLVLTFGLPLVDAKGAGLSQAESYSAHEEVYLAALDLDDAPLAKRCIEVLAGRFPGSFRVRTLQAMAQEAGGRFNEALSAYNAILEDDPANTLVMKRRVAVLESMGNTTAAAQALVEYLALYSSDGDAWLQLGKIYLVDSQYRKAAFCYEELLLLAPTNHVFHTKYADILYTLGGPDVKTARKYYAHSLNICPQNNARALYGLMMCCQAMASAGPARSKDKDDARKTAALLEFASTQLEQMYAGKASVSDSTVLSRMLEGLA